jgi:hypothetical protein
MREGMRRMIEAEAIASSNTSVAHGRNLAPGPAWRVVLDTCILKLATVPVAKRRSRERPAP